MPCNVLLDKQTKKETRQWLFKCFLLYKLYYSNSYISLCKNELTWSITFILILLVIMDLSKCIGGIETQGHKIVTRRLWVRSQLWGMNYYSLIFLVIHSVTNPKAWHWVPPLNMAGSGEQSVLTLIVLSAYPAVCGTQREVDLTLIYLHWLLSPPKIKIIFI